ncbi:MAG: hypothetical protein GC149_02295 [Gammaproteobacteria bacterium]|nr:hypothetical protein [Gammaproteobacteria bacterium]
MYLPIIGLLFAAANFLHFLISKTSFRKPIKTILTGSIVLGYGAVSWIQAGVWYNTESLFIQAADVTKGNYIAHTSLAIYYLEHNENKKAWFHYQMARESNPKYENMYMAIESILIKQKKYDALNIVVGDMLKAGVNVEDGERMLAQIMVNKSQYDEAVIRFQHFLAHHPDDEQSLYGIGYAYYRLKKNDLALYYLLKLEKRVNGSFKLMELLGDIYHAKGDEERASYYHSLAKEIKDISK